MASLLEPQTRWPFLMVVSLWIAALAAGVGCGGESAPAPSAPAPEAVAPASLAITAESTGLVFRYVDPESGAAATASRWDAVPDGARAEVVVLDPDAPAPAGWELVADLSGGLPVTAEARQGYVLPVRVEVPKAPAPEPVAAAAARAGAQADVNFFTSRHCGYCRKARAFLDKHGVAYSEYDVETDRRAKPRLQELAQAAGVSPSQLRGVPILFIGAEPMVGWSEPEARRLLGI